MRALSRFFASLAGFFESHASAKELDARIAKLEASHEQLRLDMAKCKMMVGLNRIMDVTASEV